MADPHELLRAFLADRDEPCPSCGYNLRGLTTNHCPECAVPLGMGLTARSPLSRGARRGILAFALITLAVSLTRAGFSFFWCWRFGATVVASLPISYAVLTIGEGVFGFASAMLLLISLRAMLFSKASTDERALRCLRWTVIAASIIAISEMSQLLTFLL